MCGGVASSSEEEDGDDPWRRGASTGEGSFVFTFERKWVGSIGKTGKLGRSSRRFRRLSGYRDGGQFQGSEVVEWESDRSFVREGHTGGDRERRFGC